MFGERLKLLRNKNSMTQQDLANLLNISPSAIGMYEQNRRDPDTDTIKFLADYFNCSVDYLLGRTDNPKDGSENLSDADLEEFIKNHNIKFCGEPVDKEDKEDLLDFMKLAYKTIRGKKNN